MSLSETERLLRGLVRVGTVTDIDEVARKCRVKFNSEKITSGWLYVLQHRETTVRVMEDGGHNHEAEAAGAHFHPGSTGEGLSIATDGSHSHQMTQAENHEHKGSHTTWWMPKINDSVVCLYVPVFSGDGFILGGI